MIDSSDTPAATEPSPLAKVVKPSRTRGYVPKGSDVEPDQAPTGAAGTSTPVSDDEQNPEGKTDG
ncbi:MAG: hypothetical protein ACRDRX_25280 [Pseudonocardiaceae bacterium]